MKKLIIITSLLLLVAMSISNHVYAGSPDSPYYLQFTTASYKQYIGKDIFIITIDGIEIHQGKCLAIGENGITIRDISGANVKILTIPMKRIKNYYMMEEK